MLATLLVLWTDIPRLEELPAWSQLGLGTWHKRCPGQEPGLSWVEFFAGKAEATRMFKLAGYRVAKLDIEYMREYKGYFNPMDLCSPAGMACLGLAYIAALCVLRVWHAAPTQAVL